MTSPRDLENGVAVADGDSKSRKLLQRMKQGISKSFFAVYTHWGADQDWRSFLEGKHVDSSLEFPKGPAKLTFVLQDLSIFRRFDWLSTYCLFQTQQSLANCEAELLTLCQERLEYGSNHREEDHSKLVKTIRETLLEYSSLADTRYKLLDYRDPEPKDYDSLLNLFHKKPKTVEGIDSSWLFKVGDLMTVDPKPPMTHLTRCLSSVLTVLPVRVFRLLYMTNSIDHGRYPRVRKVISHDRLMGLTLVIAAFLALVFILVPVGTLYIYAEEWSKWAQFGVIIGWSGAFLFYLWLGTHASPHEALGSAASYCALLVVFLGLS